MKKSILPFIVIIAAVLGLGGWSVYQFVDSNDSGSSQDDFDDGMIVADPEDEDGDSSDDLGLETGEKAPDFELETLDGDKAKLSDYEGERVIVNFWATWCPPCREEIPDLKKLYDEEDNLEILAVNMTSDETSDMDEIEKFANEEFDMPFPVLLDHDDEVRQAYKVVAYPTSYMVDSDGKIQDFAMGAMTHEQMKSKLDEID